MKIKTHNRLKRKWENRPLHHIDACIVLDLIKGDLKSSASKSYMNKVGTKVRGKFSIHVYREITVNIKREINEHVLREEAYTFLNRRMDSKEIEFYSPKFKAFRLVDEIRHKESRIEPSDALHLATAIENGADVFVTKDKTLVNNRNLQNAFKLKIIHPINA